MEITHLSLSDMYEALAVDCNSFEEQKDGYCFADARNLGCPFGASRNEKTVNCKDIKPAHWREVFEGKDEPEPQFQFGDKVTWTGGHPREGIFSAYCDQRWAYVLFEGENCCEVVAVCNLKAGWDD